MGAAEGLDNCDLAELMRRQAAEPAVESADQWRLEVEDSGIGMTSSEQQRAFEEYFSGGVDSGGGVGLGLAIAHRLCTTLSAQIRIQSAPGQGTLFSVVFPRHFGEREACPKRDP